TSSSEGTRSAPSNRSASRSFSRRRDPSTVRGTATSKAARSSWRRCSYHGIGQEPRMDSAQSIREHLDRIIATGEPLAALRKQWIDRCPSDSRPFRRLATKAWVAQAALYKQICHWGKFRRALMLGGVVLGLPFDIDLEQAGLLLPGDAPYQEFSTCLRDLARQLP